MSAAVTPLSIVIPTLGRAAALPEVLRGLATQTPPLADGEVEVIVALDAAAAEGAETGALAAVPRLAARTVRATRPGASAARNAGWRAARAPLILFLDDDIVPSRRLVAAHRAGHAAHPEPEIGGLGPVRWARRVRVTPFMRWLETGVQFDYATITGPDAGWERFYSCNVSVKRELLERVGGFDEERFPYGYEDLELARRMSAHGFRLLLWPGAAAEHLKRETLDGWRRNLPRIAQAERRFCALYPDVPPYFHDRFAAAAAMTPTRGRLARLVAVVPPQAPGLGRRLWGRYDLWCCQQLAGEFLAEWEAAAIGEPAPAAAEEVAR